MYLVVSSYTLRPFLHRRYYILAYCSERVSKEVSIYVVRKTQNVAILLQLGERCAMSEAVGYVPHPRRTDGVPSDAVRIRTVCVKG